MVKEQLQSDFLLDNRIIQRNIRDGRIERSVFEKHIASLPDLKEQCEDIGEEIYRSKRTALTFTGEFTSSEQDEE